ncbi:peptidoglycan-binding domain-containing protein [Microvirga subterranea]|uniref:Putative peptidoglycan binding protein n=1 Tax=Microvirga subterranea TaxID=186651 RepID=A0A370HIV5_9HYPH|nr:putative peptidoglycan binding protein [Microvirga subterranea]
MEAHTSNKVATYKVTSGVLGVLALLGWGLYGYSLSSSGTEESRLREQTTRLQNDLNQLNTEHRRVTAEYEQLRQSAGDLQGVQGQLASVQEQVKSLEQARAQLTESVAQARSQLTSSTAPSADDARASQTGTANPSTGPVRIDAAQEALTRLGYGPLTADGKMGSRTRRAIEAFERAQGLAVTGSLERATVQALEANSGVSIQ